MTSSLRRRFHFLVLALSLLLTASAPFAGGTAADLVATERNAPPEGLTASEWSGIQAKLRADRYAVSWLESPGEWYAYNAAQGLRAWFNEQGVRIEPRSEGNPPWTLGMSLRSFGYQDSIQPLSAVKPTGSDNRIEYTRNTITEWYVNDEKGIEQGFTIGEPPAKDHPRGTLRLRLQLNGPFKPKVLEDNRSLRLVSKTGGVSLLYDDLKAWDANGDEVTAYFAAGDGTISILADDRDAVYPLTIDPTLTQEAKLLGDGGGVPGSPSDMFGRSVAVSGDTMVVGALYDDLAQSNAGAAYVFVRSGTEWALQQKLTASDAAASDLFGISVAVSGDTAVVGAYVDDDAGSNSGSAYVFVRSAGVWSEQQKLTASDAAASDYFGRSVAVSGDTAIVGAHGDGSYSGSAYVFVRSAGVWSEQQTLTASDPAVYDNFGYSVAVSGDTAIVGAHADDDADSASGSAYVFVRSAGVWSEQQKLTASDAAASDFFGISVAVSGDTAVVGAYADDDAGSHSGSAYVFVRSAGVWSEQQKLTASDAAAYDYFGYSVAVSGDTAVVGAYADDDAGSDSGSAYVFVRSAGVWSEQQKLTASDAAAYDYFGYSVAVSGDTAVVGAYANDDAGSDSGSAYVFVRSTGVWSEQEKVLGLALAAYDYFGYSVAVSGDTAVVGAYADDDAGSHSGSAYVFVRSAGVWSEQQKLTASDAAASDYFGISVAVSGDTAVVGAYADDDAGSYSGSAYVFVRSAGVWSEQQKLTASDAAASDYFGRSVAVSGDTAIVGAYADDDAGSHSGSAYVFVRSAGVWSEQQKLTASDAAASDLFGISVAVSGDTAVVGAHADDDAGSDSGSAYVFVRSAGVWSEQQKLTASDAAVYDYFGISVAVSSDTAVVGAYADDDAGSDSGSAYFFVRSAGVWSEQQKLTASDAAAYDYFGYSVAVSGDTAVVGAYADDDAGSDSGSAYVFVRSAGVWSEQQKLTASDAAASDLFGISVAVSGDTAVVGADGDDNAGPYSGSAYVFAPPKEPPVASDDTAATDEGAAVNIDVAANDADPDGNLDPSSTNTACGACGEPANGFLTNLGDGTFRYTPGAGFYGTDIFVYEICDTDGLCDTATATITVICTDADGDGYCSDVDCDDTSPRCALDCSDNDGNDTADCLQCVMPPSDLVAWWMLDGNALDAVDSHHGTLFGGASYTPGKVESALLLDGVNDYAWVPDSVDWTFAGDFTIDLWTRFDSAPGGFVGYPGSVFVGHDEGGGSQRKWFFSLGQNKLTFHIHTGFSSVFIGQFPFAPNIGQFYHLAVSRSGNTYSFYVDGVLLGSADDSMPILDASAALTIGQAENLGYHHGVIDEVEIFHRALLPEEIAEIFDAGSTGKCRECPDEDTDDFADCSVALGCDPSGRSCDCDDTNPNCSTDCTDGDSDGYCVTDDCDDAVGTCLTDCTADVDVDGIYDCADSCIDIDGDGYGTTGGPAETCAGGDCDDADPNNWTACGTCLDADTDGWYVGCDVFGTIDGPDCDETDGTVYPGATELCDGQDNDCDTVLPPGEIDSEVDGYVACLIDAGGWDGAGTPLGGDNCPDVFNPAQTDTDVDGLGDACDDCLFDPPHATGICPTERAALAAFYASTSGGISWCTDPGTCSWMDVLGTECTWNGVTCTTDGLHVSRIQLAWSTLDGALPPEIGDLPELFHLQLDHNSGLRGTIPPEIGKLTKLRYFGYDGATGPIPDEFGNLVNLEEFHCPYGGLSGPIPDSFGNLVKLRRINLFSNRNTGTGLETPAAGMGIFAGLVDLETMELGSNALSGDLQWLATLNPDIVQIGLGLGNSFTGEIPDGIENLTGLIWLDLRQNPLSGDLDRNDGSGTSWLDALDSLEVLYLGSTGLAGALPAELGLMPSLRILSLDHTGFTSPIPDLGGSANLEELYLGWTPLSGDLYRTDGTSWLGDLTNLRLFDIRHTSLEGTIPDELGNLTNLQQLWINGTNMSGPIPDVFATMDSLYSIEIAGTPIDGPIPASLGSAPSLWNIRLFDNYLTGTIPPELGNLTGPIALHLNRNRLSGPIPPELGNVEISALSLEGNRLSGPIPVELTNQTGATWLMVRYNALYTDDPAVQAFMDSKDTQWSWTQTVAPDGVSVDTVTIDSVSLSWTPIVYTGNGGGYRILYSTNAGGPYTEAGMTAGKTISTYTVDGLTDGTQYYFVVQAESNPHYNLATPIVSEYSSEVSAATVLDADGDGFGTDTDCNDADTTVYPGAGELCDGQDNDCDAVIPANEIDDDGDGYVECTVDSGGWDGPVSVIGGDDCLDADPNNWSSCAACVDDDSDGVYSGCDTFETIHGPDCDDTNTNCTGDCTDADADAWCGTQYDVVENGDFKTSVPSNGTGGGWTSSIVDHNGGWRADGTNHYFGLNHGGQAGSDPAIEQTLTGLVPGRTYVVRGDFCASILEVNPNALSFGIEVDGNAVLELSSPGRCPWSGGSWYPFSVEFAATAASHTIRFTGERNGDDTDYAIDNIVTSLLPDCDDGDPNNWTSCTTCIDDDGDAYFIDCDTYSMIDGPDCDDAKPNCTTDCTDVDADGFCRTDDCDDADATAYPGAPELCDGQDNDCDTVIPTGETDDDDDGYVECNVDAGGWDGAAISGGDDCDDADPNNWTACGTCVDADADGWYVGCDVFGTINGPDCDETDGTVYPGAAELCDGQDNDCDTMIPTGEIDDDLDGYVECTIDAGGWEGPGTVVGGDDCEDGDATVYPGATELCDGIDNDCDSVIPSDESDDDGDGHVECTVDPGGWDAGPAPLGDDCDDTDATVLPGAVELCDGQDNDCDGVTPAVETDDDGDGYVECVVDPGGWDGTLFVTDAITLEHPAEMALSPDGTTMYVHSQSTNPFIAVIDIATRTIVDQVSGYSVYMWDISPDGRWILGSGSGQVERVDTQLGVVLPPIVIPGSAGLSGMTITPDGAKAYLSDRSTPTGTVYAVDIATGTYEASIPCSGGWPFLMGIDATPDSTRVYTVGRKWGNVDVIDVASNTCTPAVATDLGSSNILARLTVSPDGTRAWVTSVQLGRIAVIDTDPASPTYHTQVATIDTDAVGLGKVTFSPDGQRAYVPAGHWSPAPDIHRVLVFDANPASPGYTEQVAWASTGTSPWYALPIEATASTWVSVWDPQTTGGGSVAILGSLLGGSDCDDTDPTTYPGAVELCDGQDNDCDGLIPPSEADDDGDGYVECTLDAGGWDGTAPVTDGDDCDDAEATCTTDCTTDADGDGLRDCSDTCLDADGDGFGVAGGAGDSCIDPDCDDGNPTCNIDCTDTDTDGFCITHDCDDADGAHQTFCPPVAEDDSTTTAEEAAATVDVAANDHDPNGNLDPASANTACATCGGPGNGAVVNHDDGTFTYTPDLDFYGTDSFVYEICDSGDDGDPLTDGDDECDTATVTITVDPVNDAPVADDQSLTTDEDVPLDITLTASDVDDDAQSLSYSIVTPPAHGTLDVVPCDFGGPYTSDGNTLLLLHFDGTLAGADDETPSSTWGTFHAGRFGQGVNATADMSYTWLDYPAAGNIDPARGALELWVQPQWNGNDGQDHTWLSAYGAQNHNHLLLKKDAANNMLFAIHDDNGNGSGMHYGISDWIAGEWHHLAILWQAGRQELYVDGVLRGSNSPATMPLAYSTLNLSHSVGDQTPLWGWGPESVIDELRVSDIPRLGDAASCSGSLPVYTPDQDYNGPDSFTFKANDGELDSNVATVLLTVDPVNDGPVADAGADLTADEGATVSLSGSVTDPDAGDTHSYDWDFGDTTSGSGSLAPTHVYADNGTYTGTLTVTDAAGVSGSDMLTVTVNNAAPTVDAGADLTGDEGSPVSLPPSTFNDPGTSDSHTATIDWGDGTPVENGAVTESPYGPPGDTAGVDGGVDGSHPYAADGTYTVRVTVTDDEGASSSDTLIVTISNVAPTAEAGGPYSTNEGASVTLDGSGSTDPGNDIATYEWDFDNDGAYDDTTGVAPAFSTTDDGPYTIGLKVTDDDGAFGTATSSVTVNNVAPTAHAGGPYTTDEGTAVTLDGLGSSDPGNDIATYAWDFDNDGAYDDATGVAPAFSTTDDGLYTVGLLVTDDDGATGTTTTTVIVNNVAPTVYAGPDSVIDNGGFVSSGSFTDPGADTWTATVDWGEGGGPQPLALYPGKSFDLDHGYADKGTYTVTVCVTDDEGAVGCDTATVVNYLTTAIAVQDLSAQYSDGVLMSATLTDWLTRPVPGAELTFDVAGICGGTAITDTAGTAMLTCGPLATGVGMYPIDVSFVEGNPPLLRGSFGQGSLNELHEDTEIEYDRGNPLSVRVASDGGDSLYFELTVEVMELIPDAAGVDQGDASLADHGDIALAVVTMELVPIGPGGSVSATCALEDISGTGYGAELTATCGFSDVAVETYSVYTRVTGNYYAGEIEEPLTIYDPSLGFTTGGGWLYWPGTDDPATGYPGDKTNFGFTVKYNNNQQNIRGNLLVMRHLRDKTKYRIKSNALEGLALGEGSDAGEGYGWTDFSGKCTYLEPGMDDALGNYWFAVFVEDRNEPGTGIDRFWLQVKDKDRILIDPMSLEEPAVTHKLAIGGGNIQVPHDNAGNGDPPVCDDDNVCEPGEDCTNCGDCAGVTGGPPRNRYCCGDGTQQDAETSALCDGNF